MRLHILSSLGLHPSPTLFIILIFFILEPFGKEELGLLLGEFLGYNSLEQIFHLGLIVQLDLLVKIHIPQIYSLGSIGHQTFEQRASLLGISLGKLKLGKLFTTSMLSFEGKACMALASASWTSSFI